MRKILVLSVTAAALLVTSCKSADKPAEPGISGEVAAAAALRLEIGGQLVDVGDHKVELRMFGDGRAEARVMDARGKAIAAPEEARVTVSAKAKAAATPTAIDLAYEPKLARFAGKAAAKVDLEAAPIDVELELGDKAARGKLEAPVLLVGPEMGGTLFVAGKYGVEIAALADGSVEAIVHDAAGVKVSGDAAVKLEAKVAAAEGTATTVVLAWDEARGRFVGRAEAAAKIVAGPAEISIDGAVAAKVPKLALRAEAAHGGRVIVAGDYSVELVAKGNAIQAFVFDASAAAVAKADIELSLRVGSGAFVNLVWDGPSASYRADLDGAVDLAFEPITVAVKTDAAAFVGASVPKIDAEAKAKVAANADVKAPGAKAPAVKAGATIKPVSVKKSAGASAGTGAGGGANANAKAGFSFGTK